MFRRSEFCRPLRAGEEAAVARLLRRAFENEGEVRLVERLRRDGAIAGELVLPDGAAIIGYCALSEMRGPQGWLCLGPVAIDPGWQDLGHGHRMVAWVAEWARRSGCRVVVLGAPDFYQTAGFSRTRAQGLRSPFPVTNTLLAGPGRDVPEVELCYPSAFEET